MLTEDEAAGTKNEDVVLGMKPMMMIVEEAVGVEWSHRRIEWGRNVHRWKMMRLMRILGGGEEDEENWKWIGQNGEEMKEFEWMRRMVRRNDYYEMGTFLANIK